MAYSYSTLRVSCQDFVLHVELDRTKKLNAINGAMFEDLQRCFQQAHTDKDVRVVVLSGGDSKMFSAGIDIQFLSAKLATITDNNEKDRNVGHIAFHVHDFVTQMQNAINVINDCKKPVVAVVHGKCLGAAAELVAAADIRLCTQDVCFSIREAKMGLAPDLGALTRLQKICGNDSLAREACYTAKDFGAAEAQHMGLVSRVLPTKDACVAAALTLAQDIAENSPVAIATTKRTLNYCRDHTLQDGLEYVATINGSMAQSKDLAEAIGAQLTKTKPAFSKL